MRIIRARCPGCPDADLALIGTIHPARPSVETASVEAVLPPAEIAWNQAVLPVEIGEQIMDAIAALEEKLDWLAEAVGVNKDEDDDDAAGRRRRAGA